jgi:hypothetical protein
MGWLELADITLHSGRHSSFKIECDELTDAEVEAACSLLVKALPSFGSVHGVPRGGLRMERALLPYRTSGPPLVVDDVWTTGGSVQQFVEEKFQDREVAVAVLFARGPVPAWVVVLFTLHSKLWNS